MTCLANSRMDNLVREFQVEGRELEVEVEGEEEEVDLPSPLSATGAEAVNTSIQVRKKILGR